MRIHSLFRTGTAIFLLSSSLAAQQPDWALDSTTGRPLLDLVRELRSQFGLVITYEDPPYDMDHQVPSGRTFEPAAPRMHFSLPASQIAAVRQGDINARYEIVRSFVAQHTAQTRAGDPVFWAENQGARISIAPMTPMKPGQFATLNPYRSPLSVPVTLSPARSYANMGAAVQDIVAQASKASGVPIMVGSVPNNIFFNNKVLFDPPEGVAFTATGALGFVLSQVNAGEAAALFPNAQLVWDLLAGGNPNIFVLNVNGVPHSEPPRQILQPTAAPASAGAPGTGFVTRAAK